VALPDLINKDRLGAIVWRARKSFFNIDLSILSLLDKPGWSLPKRATRATFYVIEHKCAIGSQKNG